MSFKLIKKFNNGVRIGELETAHGKIETPFFMPVGTVGSVKGVSSEELEDLGAQIILANTYHLYLRPGEKLIQKLGGLHRFMNWDGPILTDSGGYQVFSLAQEKKQFKIQNSSVSAGASPDGKFKNNLNNSRTINNLVKITEEGVEFTSHLDGSKHLFTPEKVIQIQLDLGVDTLMPLDVCLGGKASYEEVKEACRITTNWAARSKEYFDEQVESDCKVIPNSIRDPKVESGKQRPLLHGIVQGGLYEDLRRKHAKELIELDFDGYSVGGLAVDNETRDMWKIVKLMGKILPENKQRYLMGVGTPDDIIKAASLGMDMFDCVLPTRMGRHGSVYVKSQPACRTGRKSKVKSSVAVSGSRNKFGMTSDYMLVNLLNSKYREDGGVIDQNCLCPACKGGYSRAYISHLLRSGEILGIRLTTIHNLRVYLELMREIRVN